MIITTSPTVGIDGAKYLNNQDFGQSSRFNYLEDITELAAKVCKVKGAFITLLGQNYQWYASSYGIRINQSLQSNSFSRFTQKYPHHPLNVYDASQDERFKNDPLVVSGPKIRFYAALPLIGHEGKVLGALCVMDQKVGELNSSQLKALRSLAEQSIRVIDSAMKKTPYEQSFLDLCLHS